MYLNTEMVKSEQIATVTSFQWCVMNHCGILYCSWRSLVNRK